MGMAILLITHNLGVVAQFADGVAVMYAGKIVEQAEVLTLFKNPLHPYTRALLKALPRPGRRAERLMAIKGTVPSPLQYPKGCAFALRCPDVLAHCPDKEPALKEVELEHKTACWLYESSENERSTIES
jgi:oligopeptide/dipeptide ABC transporter ATP-binding protein